MLALSEGIEWGYRIRLRDKGILRISPRLSHTAHTALKGPSKVSELSIESYLPHHNDFEPECPIPCFWIGYTSFVERYLVPASYDTGAHISFPISCILVLYLHHSIREYAKKDENVGCGYSMWV